MDVLIRTERSWLLKRLYIRAVVPWQHSFKHTQMGEGCDQQVLQVRVMLDKYNFSASAGSFPQTPGRIAIPASMGS